MPNGFWPISLIQIYHKPEKKNVRIAVCASPILHLVSPSILVFLLGITIVPTERKDNAFAIVFFWRGERGGGGGGGGK